MSQPLDDEDKALFGLYSDLAEIESEIAALEMQRQQLREQIGMLVAERGKVQLYGYTFQLTKPSVVVRVNKEQLLKKLERWKTTHPDLAAEIENDCLESTLSAGSLRITKPKTT